MTTPNNQNQARRAKIIKQATAKSPAPAAGGSVPRGAFTTTNTTGTFTFGADHSGVTRNPDQTWVIELVQEVLERVSPTRSGAFKAITGLLTERYATGARGAMQLAAEYAGHETEETCEAIRALAADGWSGTLAELIDAARAL